MIKWENKLTDVSRKKFNDIYPSSLFKAKCKSAFGNCKASVINHRSESETVWNSKSLRFFFFFSKKLKCCKYEFDCDFQ